MRAIWTVSMTTGATGASVCLLVLGALTRMFCRCCLAKFWSGPSLSQRRGFASSPLVLCEAQPPSVKAGACQVHWILRSCRGNFWLGCCFRSRLLRSAPPPTPQPERILAVLSNPPNPPESGLRVCFGLPVVSLFFLGSLVFSLFLAIMVVPVVVVVV